MPEDSPAPKGSDALSRRTALAGAAWAVPTIAVAAAAPAYAASACVGTATTYAVTGAFQSISVPAGTRAMTYRVLGGGGGRASATGGGTVIPGSQGAVAAGRIAFTNLTAPLSLRVYVGQGGATAGNGGAAAGGFGYGTGGSSSAARPASENQAATVTGGGGGGSAITTSTGVPLIVSGGGGGGGISEYLTGSTKQQEVLVTPFQGLPYGRGDAFGAPNSRGSGMAGASESVTTFSVSPALAPSGPLGGTGGLPGGGSTYLTTNWTPGVAPATSAGTAGGSFGTTIGGNGGNGAAPLDAISGTRVLTASAGGGGGGYAGGGGGGIARARFGSQQNTTAAVSTGAAGSSFAFAGPQAVGAATLTLPRQAFSTPNPSLAPSGGRGHAGQVVITYCS